MKYYNANTMIFLKPASILISILLVVGILLSGCSNTASENMKVTATKHGISFSFEYPPSYTGVDPMDFIDTDNRDPAISILYREPGSNLSKGDKLIYIRPCDPVPDRPDASTWTEEHIEILEVGDPRFELIEQSTTQVAGIDGEYIKYHSSVVGTLLNTTDTVCLDAYIDYQGYIWKFSVIVVPGYEDEARADFELVVNSFEFLD
jgi:hypothetical protein